MDVVLLDVSFLFRKKKKKSISSLRRYTSYFQNEKRHINSHFCPSKHHSNTIRLKNELNLSLHKTRKSNRNHNFQDSVRTHEINQQQAPKPEAGRYRKENYTAILLAMCKLYFV